MFESPYVFDNLFRETCMFVAYGGGFPTSVFDESVFPDRIIPQPGPFEPRLGMGTGGFSADTFATALNRADGPFRTPDSGTARVTTVSSP